MKQQKYYTEKYFLTQITETQNYKEKKKKLREVI